MSETDGQAELRALDREIAELMEWTPETFSDGVYWRDRTGVLWPYLPNFSGCNTLDPRVQWEGFVLLVNECKRRGWAVEIASHTEGWMVDSCGRYDAGASEATLPHAFARAMRDALKAAREAQSMTETIDPAEEARQDIANAELHTKGRGVLLLLEQMLKLREIHGGDGIHLSSADVVALLYVIDTGADSHVDTAERYIACRETL